VSVRPSVTVCRAGPGPGVPRGLCCTGAAGVGLNKVAQQHGVIRLGRAHNAIDSGGSMAFGRSVIVILPTFVAHVMFAGGHISQFSC